MTGHQVLRVRSDKDEHFTGAIVQHAEERENITMPAALGGRLRLVCITLISDQQLAWELDFWFSKTFSGAAVGADLDLDTFAGKWAFAAADGTQIGGAGPYYYHISGLDIPYRDNDHPQTTAQAKKAEVASNPKLHVCLVNRSAAAKTAGAAGEIVAEFGFVPTN